LTQPSWPETFDSTTNQTKPKFTSLTWKIKNTEEHSTWTQQRRFQIRSHKDKQKTYTCWKSCNDKSSRIHALWLSLKNCDFDKMSFDSKLKTYDENLLKTCYWCKQTLDYLQIKLPEGFFVKN
jgi:hypothetical protein